MRVCLICSYASDSHLSWANNFKSNSKHEVHLITLPGRYWKLRMQSSAFEVANSINSNERTYDLFLVTSFLNVPEFKGFLVKKHKNTPVHLYFHENQFSYPVSGKDPDGKTERLEHYQFIQLKSFLSAEKAYFNSNYNRETFLKGAKKLLNKLPEDNSEFLTSLEKKTFFIWPLQVPAPKEKINKPNDIIFLWNHRWEEDKNPEGFIKFLRRFRHKTRSFKIIITAKESKVDSYKCVLNEFKEHIIHYGNVSSKQKYRELLKKATYSIVTSNHDFFGISAIEGLLYGVKTFFPKRLVYPEHFSEETWNEISYDSFEEIMDKMEYYPLDQAIKDLEKYHSFIDIDEI